jgi:hypothetical protein
VLSWDAELEVANKQITELEDRISALSEEPKDSARVQRILTVREQHLERAKFHARFIEHKIAQGCREVKPIPYYALASICFSAARRTAQSDTAERLKALGKNFSAKATAEASGRLSESDRPDGKGRGTYSPSHRNRWEK